MGKKSRDKMTGMSEESRRLRAEEILAQKKAEEAKKREEALRVLALSALSLAAHLKRREMEEEWKSAPEPPE